MHCEPDHEERLAKERGEGRAESEDVEGQRGGQPQEEAAGEHYGVEAVDVCLLGDWGWVFDNVVVR